MIGFYLITGFLGAGKTTFLKNFICLKSKSKMRIIVNEFGKAGIDGELLREMNIAVDEINNGSIFCSCRLDQFEEVMENAIVSEPDLIIVEASGLSDPTNIRKILSESPKFSNIEYLGGICIVDALNFEKTFSTSRICKKQISVSDIVLINKTDLACVDKIESVKATIHANYPDTKVHLTAHGEIKPEWVSGMQALRSEGSPRFQTKDLGLQKSLLSIKDGIPRYTLVKLIQMFVEDTYRVKGFVRTEDGVYLIDCVGAMVSVEPFFGEPEQTGCVVALAGPGMPMKKSIEEAVQWYGEYIENII